MIPQHLLESSFVPTSPRPNDPGELGRLKAFYSERNRAAQEATQWYDRLQAEKEARESAEQFEMDLWEKYKYPLAQADLRVREKGIDVGAETQRYGIDVSAEIQRYGVETGAQTSANRLSFDYDVFGEQREQANRGNWYYEQEMQNLYGDSFSPYPGGFGFNDLSGMEDPYDMYQDDYQPYIIDEYGEDIGPYWNADW